MNQVGKDYSKAFENFYNFFVKEKFDFVDNVEVEGFVLKENDPYIPKYKRGPDDILILPNANHTPKYYFNGNIYIEVNDPDLVGEGDYDKFNELLRKNHDTSAYEFLSAFDKNRNMNLLGIKMGGNEWTEKSFERVGFRTRLSEE